MGKYKFWPEDVVGEAMFTSLVWSMRIDKPGDLIKLIQRKPEVKEAIDKLKSKHLWPPEEMIFGKERSTIDKLKEKFAEKIKRHGNQV